MEAYIFNITGVASRKKVVTGSSLQSLDISDLKIGLYFLKLTTDGGELIMKRFIKE